MGAPLVIKRDLLSKSQGAILNPGFGFFFELGIKERWAFQPEVNYQEQRKSFLLTGSERTISVSTVEYIRIPLLLKYSIPFKKWSLIGLIGPNPGYALRLKSGETDRNLNFTEYTILSFSENQVRRLDLGILCGIGVEKNIANKLRTTLSLRYNLGLVDIMKGNQNTFRNNGYSLDMGFMIPLRFEKELKTSKAGDN